MCGGTCRRCRGVWVRCGQTPELGVGSGQDVAEDDGEVVVLDGGPLLNRRDDAVDGFLGWQD